ncbi:hypothetical protein_gp226 [Bacillus phage vB_BceM_WH1]|nr:hypothetical protein_gp226 [Bacillus phage vB_BceM_WH1]
MFTNVYIHDFQTISEAEFQVIKRMVSTGSPTLILVDSSDLCFKDEAPLTLKTRIDAIQTIITTQGFTNVHIGHIQHYELTCPEEFDGYAMYYEQKINMWLKHFELPTEILMYQDVIGEELEIPYALAEYLKSFIFLLTNTSTIRNLKKEKQLEFWYDAMENKEAMWEKFTPECLHSMRETFLHDKVMTQRV